MKNKLLGLFHNPGAKINQQKEQKTLPPSDKLPYPELNFLIDTFEKADCGPDLFCLGDSVWERLSREDVDQRNIGQMLQDRLQGTMKVVSLSHSAYNLKIFCNLIKALERMRNRPEFLVLPINLRSFSPQWYLNPLWQFEKENRILEEFCINPKMTIPVISPVIEHAGIYNAFNATVVNYPLSNYKTVGEFRELVASVPTNEKQVFMRHQQIFIFHYTHPLSTGHPLLFFLISALMKLAEMKIKTFVYITPINYQAGVRFCGEKFLEQTISNVRVIDEVISGTQEKGHIIYSDFSLILPSNYFFNIDNATEHLNERGRQFLSERIKEKIISMRTKER